MITNFTHLSGITGPTNLPDMTSLVASGRLQNAIKYWTKVMRKVGPVDQRVKQDDHQLVGQAKRCATQIRSKAIRSGIFCSFANSDKCRSEVAGDVISGVAVDYVSVDVHARLGASELRGGRVIGLSGRLDPFYASLLSSI